MCFLKNKFDVLDIKMLYEKRILDISEIFLLINYEYSTFNKLRVYTVPSDTFVQQKNERPFSQYSW